MDENDKQTQTNFLLLPLMAAENFRASISVYNEKLNWGFLVFFFNIESRYMTRHTKNRSHHRHCWK